MKRLLSRYSTRIITGLLVLHQITKNIKKARNQAQEAFLYLWINREKIETVNGIRSFLYRDIPK